MGLHEEYLDLLADHGLRLDENTYTSNKQRLESERSTITARLKAKGVFKHDDGSRLSEEDFQRLLEQPQHQRWSWVLGEDQRDVEEMFHAAGYKIEVPVLVAQFPTGTVNAQVTRVSSGFLILVNTGAMMMINKIIKLLFTSVIAKYLGKSGIMNQMVLETIHDYLSSGTAQVSSRLLVLPEQLLQAAGIFLSYVESFVIAHEYAHIVNGDLNSNLVAPLKTPVGDLDVMPTSWEKEYSADMVAADVILKSYQGIKSKSGRPMDKTELLRLCQMLAAPLLFCEIDRLITEVTAVLIGESEEGILSGDHPPAFKRRASIETYYQVRSLSEQEYHWATIYPDRLFRITKTITGHEDD